MNKPNKEIPKVKDCIAYIEGCDWKFDYYNRPWYIFKWAGQTIQEGRHPISFTITELRDAFKYGF